MSEAVVEVDCVGQGCKEKIAFATKRANEETPKYETLNHIPFDAARELHNQKQICPACGSALRIFAMEGFPSTMAMNVVAEQNS